MPTPQDNKLDPEQQEYEKNFDFDRHERELEKTNANDTENPDAAPSWSRDNRPVAEQEAAPEWNNNTTPGGASENNSGGGRFDVRNALKKRVNQWIIGGAVSFIVTASFAISAALSGALVHLKELASDWSNRNNISFFDKRTVRNLKKKYFQADPNCKGTGVECRYKGGVSDKEIDEMKKAGLDPEVEEAGDKKFIKAFNTTDVAGNPVKVNVDNFEEHYTTNVKFRAAMDQIAKPSSMLLRGKATLTRVFDKFGIKRNREISGQDDEERTKNFRADEYGEGNDAEKANSVGDNNKEGDATKIDGVDQSIQQAAADERSKLEGSGFASPPSVVPDVSNLDESIDKAPEVADGLIKGGLKGAVLGVFSLIDKACSGYQLIRAVTFGAKIYKVIGLIKYAGIIMTIIDKIKAGDSKSDEVGFIASMLFKPSSKKESLGKTFFQSEGFNLIFQGKIADHRGLARFTTGTPFLKFLQNAKKTFEDLGAGKDTCKQIKSWYGQLALGVGGILTTIFSGGSLDVAGIVGSSVMSVIFSVIESYVTPLLVEYVAGTVAPDVLDAEGGYGVGNAFAAGMGAFGHFTGSANGERILTNSDAAGVEMEANKDMAFDNKVSNYGKSPFSMDSATSIPSQLALAVAPYASAPFSQSAFQTLAAIVTSPLSLFGSSFSKIVTGGVNAQSDIDKGGEYCADDDYIAMDVAVDAFCNPIPGEKESTVNDPKYDPEAVLAYMLPKSDKNPNGHDHINTDGTPKSDDYKKYIASCVDSTTPLSPDGGGSDVGEDVDTRWCIDTSEEFTMFRMFTADDSIDSAHQDSVNGTLGEEGDSTTTGSTSNTYPNGQLPDSALCPLGSAWPNQKVQCGVDDKFAALNDAFKKQFGSDMTITQSYLTIAQQKSCTGSTCATPGASQNGCGVALDFGGDVNKFGTTQYTWMTTNASTYGWAQPGWAAQYGSKPDAGHWEYGTNGLPNGGTCQT